MNRVFVIAAMKAAIVIAVGGSLVGLALSWGAGEPVVQAEAASYLAIDADIANGNRPCDPIDAEATVGMTWEHTVAVCLVNHPGAADPAPACHVDVSYDGSLNDGVDEAGTAPAYLDANPDVNDCEAQGGDGPGCLGSGWTCDPFPDWSTPPNMGPPAHINCWRYPSGTTALTEDPGLLATLTFVVADEGDDSIVFDASSEVYAQLCGFDMTCQGATIHKIVCPDDFDCDGVLDGEDNCPSTHNPGQLNTDSLPVDNGPGIGGDDVTVPSGDDLGDACDDDADNDGLPDAEDVEPLGASGICAAFAGANDLHPDPAGGDVTNDDDGDGDPAPDMGSDSADSGPSWDTDSDGALDGAECTLGFNPRNAASTPSAGDCGGTGDSDGDGLLDAWETCGWGTDKNVIDSNGDALGDCLEAADVDGDGDFTFTGDLYAYALAYYWWPPPGPPFFGRTMDFDLDKDGDLSFSGDVYQIARRFYGVVTCQ